ncbi:MAG: altronate dehydratase, partial [Halanaerobium sp. MSAO_Bac5]
LGCENNLIEDFKKYIGDYNKKRVKFLNLQDVEDDMEIAESLLDELLAYAKDFKQEEIPLSKLKIALKCGGSDSFSGVTANPLLGKISDKIASYNGISILTEVPEMFGAEKILMNRAKDKKTFNKAVKLINDFKDYFLSHDQEIYENPSPGNKAGGITTLEEKSLGCTQKGGTGIVNDVFFYGEQVEGQGLNLLESPGNDLVATTALTIAGAHLVIFTTGRGTPFGGAVPTIKVSTNNKIYAQKRNWFDFNAGQLLAGKDMESLTEEFFDYIIQVASKKIKTKNEINDYREIAIFKNGVTL